MDCSRSISDNLSILNNYCALIELWEQSLETKLDPDVKGQIIGVKSQMMTFPFLFGLLLCDRILNIADNLSKINIAEPVYVRSRGSTHYRVNS